MSTLFLVVASLVVTQGSEEPAAASDAAPPADTESANAAEASEPSSGTPTDDAAGEPEEAPVAERAAPASPNFESVRAAVNARDFATAMSEMKDLVNADPTSTRLLRLAASVAFMAQDFTAAAGYLERVLVLDEFDDPSRLNLARARMMMGHGNKAMESVDAVLVRHPQLKEGLDLREQIASGGRPGDSKIRPIARADVGVAVDTDLALGADAAPDEGGIGGDEALLLMAEAAAGVAVDADWGSFNAMARLVSRDVLTDRDTLKNLAPTSVEIAVLQRFGTGDLVGAIDFRYQELFTNFFDTHVQRLVAPTLWGSYRFGALSNVRLLGGIEYRDPDNSATPNNITAKVGIRDTIDFGKVDLILDITGRMNTVGSSDSDDDADNSPVDFMDIGGLAFITYAPVEVVQLFGLAGATGRQFDNAVATETTYTAGGGLRFFFHPFELHTDYTFTRNVSDGPRDFTRHQASVGLRAWWQ